MIIVEYSYLSPVRKRFTSEANSILIGRTSGDRVVDLDLSPDTTVSRLHARLVRDREDYWLEDLESRGGTWVNGERLERRRLITPKDEIRLGRTELVVRAVRRPDETDTYNLSQTQPIRLDQDEAHVEPDEGTLADTISASASPARLLVGGEPPQAMEVIQSRLSAFYELGAALGSAEGVEPLLTTVVDHLCAVITGAQRGAILLLEERVLRLKAYAPLNTRPSVSLHLAKTAIEKQEGFIWRYRESGVISKLTDSIVSHGTKCAMYAPLVWQGDIMGIVYVDNYVIEAAFNDEDLHLLMAMANQTAMFVKNHRLQEYLTHERIVRSNLLRQFSPQVATHLEKLLMQPEPVHLGGERVEPVTILQSDVRGFTVLTANMEPGEVMESLNQLFGVCIPLIFKYNGTVDKYIGDAILAVFGSPEPDTAGRQWENAVRAALEMQQAVQELGQEWQRMGRPVYEIGIGIHTGPVLQGFIGSPEQMEYTVIGDTVNRATRYCHGAGRGEVIISQAVYQRVQGLFEMVPKTIQTKHPDTEPDIEAYLVKGTKS
ncbi:MAG TPA: adenylate/guanylate cyclase domain-containing protein [Anaerolineae bacterium]|nr:adenylate/guanylate cyclase domain-containing protein [Anaerolineae bacterium]